MTSNSLGKLNESKRQLLKTYVSEAEFFEIHPSKSFTDCAAKRLPNFDKKFVSSRISLHDIRSRQALLLS